MSINFTSEKWSSLWANKFTMPLGHLKLLLFHLVITMWKPHALLSLGSKMYFIY
jgi:hypothetical protein